MIYLNEELPQRSRGVGGLASAVQAELDAQGKNWAWLSRETGIAESTFTKWKGDPDLIPDLLILATVASKLKITLRVLIEACGFPVDDNKGYEDRQARARALVAAVPRLELIVEPLSRLRPDDQDSLMSFIEGWLRDREKRRQNRNRSKS